MNRLERLEALAERLPAMAANDGYRAWFGDFAEALDALPDLLVAVRAARNVAINCEAVGNDPTDDVLVDRGDINKLDAALDKLYRPVGEEARP